MSSNIQVQRICQHFGDEFTARTTVTHYCGDTCSKRAYKARVRVGKVEVSIKETRRIKTQPIEVLKDKEYLTVTQVSKLIGCSRQNVYKLINSVKLNATNILKKKTIVKRSDLDKLFKYPTNRPKHEGISKAQIQELNEWKQAGGFDITNCYTYTEVRSKYGISETAVQNLGKSPLKACN